jgi:glycogen operon protein
MSTSTPTISTRVVTSGVSAPLGATFRPDGVNFSVFSKHATRMELLLFDEETATHPARAIPLDPDEHRTYHYWHIFVPDLQPGQGYAYRAQDLSPRSADFGSTPRRCSSTPTVSP